MIRQMTLLQSHDSRPQPSMANFFFPHRGNMDVIGIRCVCDVDAGCLA